DVYSSLLTFNETAITATYTVSLHDALPILFPCGESHYYGSKQHRGYNVTGGMTCDHNDTSHQKPCADFNCVLIHVCFKLIIETCLSGQILFAECSPCPAPVEWA